MKKILPFLISAALILALLTPVFAYGTLAEGEGEATLLQEGEFDIQSGESLKKYSQQPLKAVKSAEDSAHEQLLSVNAQVNLSSYSISVDDVDTFYSNVINDNPDLFFVSSSYSYNYYPSTGKIAYIFPQYAMSSDEIADAKIIFNAGVERALAEVDDSMSNLQKALVLHDYIASEGIYPVLQYDSSNQLVNDENIWHSAYGFFYNRVSVCAGFTLTYSYLLKQLGIECEYVGSNDMAHAWNKVYIDGNRYNVDITFDNHDNAQGQNTYGSVRHAHFLKSDSYFASESGSCHYGGTTYDGCAANSTVYDSAFWDDTCARIYVVNGDYYYLRPNNGKYGILYLTKRTSEGVESNVGTYFTTVYLNYTAYAFDENGTQHNIPYTDSLARLAYLDNRFYVVAGNTVYSKLLDGTQYTITDTSGNYCNGLGVNENGNLLWQPYTDSSSINVLDKLTYYDTYMTMKKTNGAAANYNNYPDINLDGAVNAKDYALIIQ